MTFDIQTVRSYFPALRETGSRKVPIYFDNPAGTQVPQQVVDAVSNYLVGNNANMDAPYEASQRTSRLVQATRQAAADLLGAESDEIVLGSNMTSLTVSVSRAMSHEIRTGDEIVISRLAHDANAGPWIQLAEDTGATIRWIDVDLDSCTIDIEDAQRKITSKTRLVAVGYASNGSGSINDVAAIINLAKAVGAWTYIDGVQYAPHGLIDVKALDCDFLSCSAYKFYGTHVGILYGKRALLQRLRTYTVRPNYHQSPARWETGTKNYEGLVGALAAIDYLAELGVLFGGAASDADRRTKLIAAWPQLVAHEQLLATRLISGLQAIPAVQVYGVTDPDAMDKRVSTIAFRKATCSPETLSEVLGQEQIASRCGHFLAIDLVDALGLQASGGLNRLGPVHYNSFEEIDHCLEVIEQA